MNISNELKTIFLNFLKYLNMAFRSEMEEIIEIVNLLLNEKTDKKILDEIIPKLQLLSKSSSPCNLGAKWLLGVCYNKGIIVQKNSKLSHEFFEDAANKHFAPALNFLGVYYELGEGVQPDLKRSFSLFQMAAEKKYAPALYNLAHYYANGKGTEKDLKKAFELCELSANQGYHIAQLRLADFYERGVVIQKNLKKAFELYELAAKQGFAPAQRMLGSCYLLGIGVKEDSKKAFEWCELSAKQGFAPAQSYLGDCYALGLDKAVDLEKAFEWYELSAKQGFPHAQFKLGECHEKGIHTEKDMKKALEMYQRAASQRHPDALFKVGEFYFDGIVVNEDMKKGIEFMELSASLGFVDAQVALGEIFLGKSNFDVNKAIKYNELASEQDNNHATAILVEIYDHTDFGCQNLHLALKYHTRDFLQQLSSLLDKQSYKKEMLEHVDSINSLKKSKNEHEKIDRALKIYEVLFKDKIDKQKAEENSFLECGTLKNTAERIEFLKPLLGQSKIKTFFEGYELSNGYSVLTKQLAELFMEYELESSSGESDKTEHKRDTSKP